MSKAMERIRKFESYRLEVNEPAPNEWQPKPNKWNSGAPFPEIPFQVAEDFKFLLTAFQKMREIAVRLTVRELVKPDFPIQSPPDFRGNAEAAINKLFEQSMAEAGKA